MTLDLAELILLGLGAGSIALVLVAAWVAIKRGRRRYPQRMEDEHEP